MTRTCLDCPTDISERRTNSIRCVPCQRASEIVSTRRRAIDRKARGTADEIAERARRRMGEHTGRDPNADIPEPASRALTDDDAKIIDDLWGFGVSVRSIAIAVGCSEGDVQRHRDGLRPGAARYQEGHHRRAA